MDPELETYHRLSAYTLARGDATFVHQYVVDAFAAQRADEATRPITLTFALVGLYLAVERGYSGRQVQHVHTLLARTHSAWPTFALPPDRGTVRVADVLAAPEGAERDRMIRCWSAEVWAAYADSRAAVVALLKTRLP